MTFTATGIALSVETRGTTDNNWQGVNQVSVQVNGEVKAYDVRSDAPYTTATLTSDNDPFYWQSTAPVTVNAWYPTGDAMPNVVVQTDQTEAADYQASDYLNATATLTFGGANDLQFTHRTAKVVVKPLEAGDGLTNDELAGATITLTGVNTGNAEDATVTPYANDTDHLALLPPQQVAAGKPFIQVTLQNSTVYSYRPDRDITLQEGKQYTYILTVHKTELELAGCTITPWEDYTYNTTINPQTKQQ